MVGIFAYLFLFTLLLYLCQRLLFQSFDSSSRVNKDILEIPKTSTKVLSPLTLIYWLVKCGGSPAKVLLTIGNTAKVAEFDFRLSRSVIVSDVSIAKEIFESRAFSVRPANSFFDFLCQGQDSGIALSSGSIWKEQRRFCQQHLKQLGFGTKSMEILIQQEIHEFLNKWSAKNGKRFSPNNDFYIPILSSLWVLLVGERVTSKNAELMSIMHGMFHGFRNLGNAPELSLLALNLKMSTINRIAHWIPIFPGILEAQKFISLFRLHFNQILNTRKKVLSEGDIPTNLMEQYILKLRQTTDETSNFYEAKGENNLTQVTLELIGAGGDTTSSTLEWAMLHLIRNPTVQDRIRDEIDTVVGKESHPCLQDIPNCPYTNAFILELLRFSPAVVSGVPHSVTEDTNVGPYFFRKDTNIFLNIYGIHHDPLIWGDPEIFRPERFLSADGKTVVKHEALCTFSVGLRRCVGEQLAHINLFLFVSSICQRFVLRFDPLLKERPPLDDENSTFFVPKTFHMVAIDRFM